MTKHLVHMVADGRLVTEPKWVSKDDANNEG